MKEWKGKYDWVMKIASTVARAKSDLKKAKVNYKSNYDWRLRHVKTKMKVCDYIWLGIQDGKAKFNMGLHTEVPFIVLDHTTRIFVIQLGDVADRLNSD